MVQFTTRLQQEIEAELLKAGEDAANMMLRAELSIASLQRKITELRSFVIGYSFANKSEEILFFKEIKPRIYAMLIFYVRVFHIESKRPVACKELQRQLLTSELYEISNFFQQNIDFYKYYSSKAVHLDEEYFTRGKYNLQWALDDYSMVIDPVFSTTHSYKIAKIQAYEKLETYISKCLSDLERKSFDGEISASTKLTWTAPKAALIELLYALQSFGVFNNSTADVKQIATGLQYAFNVELGNYYRAFQDIRLRKNGRTNFLDQLKERLTKRMDETDENPKV